MMENWMLAELLMEQRISERRKLLEQTQRLRILEAQRRQPGLRHRLACALVRLGLRLDAEATRSALVTSTYSR